ncbi:MAG: VanW family protein [Clostridia bacterium]|nr:VanW family protein [Clostridia bacterium]
MSRHRAFKTAKLSSEEKRLFLKNAAIIVTAVVALCTVCLATVASDIKSSDSFPKGIVVNDVVLYGMSYDDALKKVSESTHEYLSGLAFSISTEQKAYSIYASDFVTADVKETLDAAYKAGKTLTEFEHGEGTFYTTYYVDTDRLRLLLENIAQCYNTEPTEPTAIFDAKQRTFTYKEGRDGTYIDVEESLKVIVERVKKSEYGEIKPVIVTTSPERSVDDIAKNSVLIAEYTSVTTNNYNRNRNIELMCSYVNGTVLMPYEVLSINGLVGERTEAKGFLPAPAIMDGKRTVDDIGGGICQLSGTLYNAALLANMKVVERWPHSWPSDYVSIGLDSTLDWNTEKDLKLQNATEYNMYLAAWLEKEDLYGSNILHVAVYGKPFPEGVTVKVFSEITETIAPETAKVSYTSNLAAGSTRVLVQERMGYRARAWREFYLNGELLDIEILGSSYYAPIRGEVLKGKPNQTPADEPSVTPTEPPSEEPIVEPPSPTEPPVDNSGQN